MLQLFDARPAYAKAETATQQAKYTAEEVAQHRDLASGIWVTYQGGVYDITKFVEAHPGGSQKIMLAAGGSIEPFWAMYKQHQKAEVREILSEYKIGELDGAAAAGAKMDDPFKNEPKRHPALITRSENPRNAETPADMLAAGLLTPSELFYVRNHLPVPDIDPKAWRLRVEGEGLRTLDLSLDDLKARFKKHVIAASLQCSGNRRDEMNKVRPVKGLSWNVGAISTATWGGVLLRDVLLAAGYDDVEAASSAAAHVHFVGLDTDPLTGEVYAASIPLHKAASPAADVLLAFEMNGQPLSRDHGAPVRVVAPGITGARNVKWLGKVLMSADECQGFWQQRDYKLFSPDVDADGADWAAAPAIQDTPVTSAVCEPAPGGAVSIAGGEVVARGYAFSGGGRDVVRVDVSADGGTTWTSAELRKLPQRPGRAWAWCLWEAAVPLPKGAKPGSKLELVSRAVDESGAAQPDSVAGVWNFRGVLNNAWHRVDLLVED